MRKVRVVILLAVVLAFLVACATTGQQVTPNLNPDQQKQIANLAGYNAGYAMARYSPRQTNDAVKICDQIVGADSMPTVQRILQDDVIPKLKDPDYAFFAGNLIRMAQIAGVDVKLDVIVITPVQYALIVEMAQGFKAGAALVPSK